MPFSVPLSELRFRTSRSGGPGGQHVNRTDTRVEVLWNVGTSPSVSAAQRQRLVDGLASKLDSRGVLRVVSSEHRSQLRNREAAIERLRTLVREALVRRKTRRKTKPPPGAVEGRLAGKRRRAQRKDRRRPVDGDE
jgi:ribosome-associated protein